MARQMERFHGNLPDVNKAVNLQFNVSSDGVKPTGAITFTMNGTSLGTRQ